MNLNERIEDMTKRLECLSNPACDIPNTNLDILLGSCEVHGSYEGRRRSLVLAGKTISRDETGCPKCLAEQLEDLKRERSAAEKKHLQLRIDLLMRNLHIPERFSSCTLESYKPVNKDSERCLRVCKAYADKWPERLKQGGGLVMCGRPGTGKNHLALAIAKEIIQKHQNYALFTTAIRIARRVKSSWSKDSEITESEALNTYINPDLLIIDEIGVQFGSEAEKLFLFEIINSRYENMTPTILISNLPQEELSAFIGERVIDRMNDGGGCTLAFTWDSYRTRAGA